MKIAIFTLPLHYNYGGVLQAFALCKTLGDLGNEPYIVEEKKKEWKTLIKNVVDRNSIKRFILKEIPYLSFPIINDKIMEENLFDIAIVGSDQVWKTKNLNPKYYLSFIRNNKRIKKIAYSASFGNNLWECDEAMTSAFKENLQTFEAISVREESGVELCEKYLNIDAIWTLDPTMLLPLDRYKLLFSKQKVCSPYIYMYILGYDYPKTKEIVKSIETKTDIQVKKYHLTKNKVLKRIRKTLGVEDWLSLINYSEMLITDSFHGCVFAIIFNVPFYVIPNERGGNARIDSLLKLFELTDRLLTKPIKEYEDLKQNNIEWNKVNSILKENRELSLNFLKKAIESCN
ncbi:MAG: polysaccharide pyruvyl transferase family protein [Prevotella sp.]|nr:polysaccharide pyruvyl transferase family protein [Prevotella sp.]